MGDGQPPPRRPGPPPVPPATPRPAGATPRPVAVRPPAPRPQPPPPRAVPPRPMPAPRSGDDFALDVGAVLGRTFSAWKANLVPFSVIAFIVLGPVNLIEFFVASNAASGPGRTFMAMLLSGFANLILVGAIPYGVFEHLRGRDLDVPTILGAGFSRLLPVLGTAIVTNLIMGVSALAFCIPALFVAAMYYVTVPVTVIEEENPFNAIARSYQLTKGNVLRILGLLVLISVSVFAVTLALVLALRAGIASQAGAELLAKMILVPVFTLDPIARAVTYHDLRVGKEHSSVDDLVKVFE
jgi:hypothetical protein